MITVHTAGAEPESGIGAVSAQAVWIDLHGPTAEETAAVEAVIGIALPSREKMQEIEASSRLIRLGDALVMTVPVLTGADTLAPRTSAVTFVLAGRLLVTLRHDSPGAIATYAEGLKRAGPRPACGGDVLLGLTEAVIDRIALVLQRLGADLDGASHRIFHQHTPDNRRRRATTRELETLLRTIGHVGDLVGKARETLLGCKRVTAFLPHSDQALGTAGASARLDTIGHDLQSLTEYVDFLGNKINFLLDATVGVIGIQQNQVIKVFTLVSVLFLPPTLVASWYGMNFKLIPELQWEYGYAYAIALAVVTAVLPYWFFKRKGWL